MISREARDIVERTMRFNRRLIVELQTMNAVLKLTYKVDTSDSGKVCVSTTVETTPSARPVPKGGTPDE